MSQQKITTLIVDDEPLARSGLRLRLEKYDDVQVVAECQNGLDAVSMISQHRPDLVFLDIQMPGLNGFQVINKLKELKQPIPMIVFVTAYDSYAIKAFDVHALDYLLKPADDKRLKDALDKVREYYSTQHHDEQSRKLVNLVAELTGDDCEEILRKLASGEPVETNPYPDVLAIKDGSEVTRVNVSDIQWIDAAGDYMCVHALDGMHIMRKTMKELEQELNPQLFVRVHRSAIANIRFVKKLVSHISGEYHLILHNDTELKVSRSHRDKVKAAMKM
ncbi:two component transcriptional regulator, LytTR family [Marisediminitalea aggregata]|jgi:two-component system LytT family response regulator|uniref:Two component transcriptional regulator, LytTR family n=2 Tax=Alteromonadaceae TaxID=72275 RepID=A0A1M5ISH0_9ALTE|nr:LytTR family DNA-binding domain-containing protein [Marisediminitalea aggregata]MAH55212.1 DNA-binding response regulator [Aestuariibacter sp.]MAP19539.1 DNA-binding response regulator [Alteromonadaceae bacterium]MEC7824300.1 LytTR family DNA-binding domain-containing protein [Pseudomonadota bacterium]BBO27673.1 DNA-binding response regulator [Alteromonas sp. I4]HBY38789.1 DNA-binding response regulator [Alteromonas sp.]|tara:strand:+ start:675 stop:1502 length:828 start_codon:yes stop_codon:yes gene_type:complete